MDFVTSIDPKDQANGLARRGLPAKRLVAIAVLALAQAACGGGGGGGDSPAPGGDNNPPTDPVVPGPFTIGGTVSGLTGAGLALQNNGGDTLTVAANSTSFSFATAVANGTAYAVTISQQPAAQTCSVGDGSGTASANVTNVTISCVALSPLGAPTASVPGGDTAASRLPAVAVAFDSALNPATVDATNVTLTSPNGAVPAAVALSSDGKTITITPAARLLPLTAYTINVATAVQSAGGAPLGAAFTHSFTTADGVWQPAADASTVSTTASESPAFAMAPNGDAVAVWIEGATVKAAKYTAATGTWSTPAELAASGVASGDQSNNAVAIDKDGNAVAVWSQGGSATLHSAILKSGETTWETADTTALTLYNFHAPRIVFDAAGKAVVAFMAAEGAPAQYHLYGSELAADGTAWSAQVALSGTDPITSYEPASQQPVQMVVDATGAATVLWTQSTAVGGADPRLYSITRSAAGTWGSMSAALDAAAPTDVEQPRLSVDADGTLTAAWLETTGGVKQVFANRRAAGGAWETAPTTPLDGTQTQDATSVAVASGGSGHAMVAWERSPDGVVGRQVYAAQYSGSAWGTPSDQIDNATTTVGPVYLTMDAAGNAIASWPQLDAGPNYYPAVARYVANGTGAGWSTAAPAGTKAIDGNASGLSVDASGSALLLWTGSEGVYANSFK